MYPNEPTPVLQPASGELTYDRKRSLESKELLSRREAAEYASLIGTPVAVATYAKLACLGGGPEMVVFGRRVYYRPATIRAWIASRLRVRANTSEAVWWTPATNRAVPETEKEGRCGSTGATICRVAR